MQMKNTAVLKVFVVIILVSFLGYFVVRDASSGITGGFVVDNEETSESELLAGEPTPEGSIFNKLLTLGEEGTVLDYTSSLLNNILALRTASNNKQIVEVAGLVSEVDKSVEKLNVAEVNYAWNEVLGCVYENCGDSAYVNLIDQIATKDLKAPTNELLHSLIATYGYWNGKTIVEFSESLSKTDELIKKLKDSNAVAAWESLVECNGACEDFSARLFTVMEAVVVSEN